MAKYRFDDIAFNSTAKKKPVEEDKYTYIGLEHLDSGNLQVTRFGSEIAPKGEKLIMKKGDVLFGKRRAYQKKVAIAPFDGIFSAHGMVLRPKENVINKDYFPFFISSDYFLDAAIKISVGSLSPTINWGDLKELEFELPDMAEQERLAKILWAAEDLKQRSEKAISKSNSIISAYIENFLNNHINTNAITLKEICEVTSGLWIGKKPPYSKCKIIRNVNFTKDCRLVYNDIQDYEVQENQLKTRILQVNDLLVEKSGGSPDQPVGRCVLFNINDDNIYSFSNFTSRIRIVDLNFLPEYVQILLAHYYEKGFTREMQAQTTGISNLNMEMFLSQQFPVVNEREQNMIVSDIKIIRKSIEKLKENITNSERIINGILSMG